MILMRITGILRRPMVACLQMGPAAATAAGPARMHDPMPCDRMVRRHVTAVLPGVLRNMREVGAVLPDVALVLVKVVSRSRPRMPRRGANKRGCDDHNCLLHWAAPGSADRGVLSHRPVCRPAFCPCQRCAGHRTRRPISGLQPDRRSSNGKVVSTWHPAAVTSTCCSSFTPSVPPSSPM